MKTSIDQHDKPNKRFSCKLLVVVVAFTAATTSAAVSAICYTVLRPHGGATVKFKFHNSQHSPTSNQQVAPNQSCSSVAAAAGGNSSVQWLQQINASAPIPLQIWQTSRSNRTSLQAASAMRTWRRNNPPNTTFRHHDDQEAAAFVLDVYGQDIYDAFNSFPLGVMRADFWRYAVLYAYGGIYADLDTKCLRPLSSGFHRPALGSLRHLKGLCLCLRGIGSLLEVWSTTS